jgi:hypothetical protein
MPVQKDTAVLDALTSRLGPAPSDEEELGGVKRSN